MLGVFAFNGTGVAFTSHPDQRVRSWQENVDIAQLADKLDLEALVSFARWLPLGGDDSRTGLNMDPVAWTAAVGALTERIAVITTIHSFALSPVFVAKSVATMDQITNGRAGLNIVVGWNEKEAGLFGGLKSHEDRYGITEEWLEVMEKLWKSTESFDYDGKHFSLRNAISNPRPVQSRPLIMNAGSSDQGRDFAASRADMAFILVNDRDPKAIKAQVDAYRESARTKFGRDIQVWTHSYVVQRPSLDEAQAYVNEYAVEMGDIAAADAFMEGTLGINPREAPQEVLDHMRFGINAGAFGFPLVGSAEDITASLQMLSDAGVDGVLLTWLDYNSGLQEFGDTVLPLLENAGLRSAG